MFGGNPEWLNKHDIEAQKIANTTILRFGELSPCCLYPEEVLYCISYCIIIFFSVFFI